MRLMYGELVCWAVVLVESGHAKELVFDLINPKILLGLLIGALLPYIVPAALFAPITKWLIFRLTRAKAVRPGTGRLALVTILEVVCAFSTVTIASTLRNFLFKEGMHPLAIVGVLAVVAMCLNLLLFPRPHAPGATGFSQPRRYLYALGLGLVYYFWLGLVFLGAHFF